MIKRLREDLNLGRQDLLGVEEEIVRFCNIIGSELLQETLNGIEEPMKDNFFAKRGGLTKAFIFTILKAIAPFVLKIDLVMKRLSKDGAIQIMKVIQKYRWMSVLDA